VKRTKENISTVQMKPERKTELEPDLEFMERQPYQPYYKVFRKRRFNPYRFVGVKDKGMFTAYNRKTPQKISDVIRNAGYAHVER
jgi:hypothetical protein